jgi:carbon monoxide dehydrogenase subunit G
MKGEMKCVVNRPVEEVFDFLADIRNEAAWNPRVVRIDKTSDGSIGAGTIFHGLYKGIGPLRTELVEYERPGRLSFRSSGPRMRIAGTFVLSVVQGESSVALNADLEPQGPFRLIAPLMAPLIKRQNAAAATRLQQALEKD